jgi:hypothetical protein
MRRYGYDITEGEVGVIEESARLLKRCKYPETAEFLDRLASRLRCSELPAEASITFAHNAWEMLSLKWKDEDWRTAADAYEGRRVPVTLKTRADKEEAFGEVRISEGVATGTFTYRGVSHDFEVNGGSWRSACEAIGLCDRDATQKCWDELAKCNAPGRDSVGRTAGVAVIDDDGDF